MGGRAGIANKHNADLDEATLLDSLRSVCGRNEESIRSYFERVNEFRPPFAENTFEPLFKDLAEVFTVSIDLEETTRGARYAYQSLLKKQLVEDPVDILIGVISIAVLGLLPTGSSCLTKKGRIMKLRYRAAFVDIVYQRQRAEKTLNIDLRIVRLVNAFKAGLVETLSIVCSADLRAMYLRRVVARARLAKNTRLFFPRPASKR